MLQIMCGALFHLQVEADDASFFLIEDFWQPLDSLKFGFPNRNVDSIRKVGEI